MANTPAENVRFVLGATGENAGILTPEEIDQALEMYPQSWRLAAAAIADRFAALAAQRRRPISFSATGDMSVSWTDDVKKWQDIALRLKQEHDRETDADNAPVGLQSRSMAYRQDIDPPEYAPRRSRYGGMKR